MSYFGYFSYYLDFFVTKWPSPRDSTYKWRVCEGAGITSFFMLSLRSIRGSVIHKLSFVTARCCSNACAFLQGTSYKWRHVTDLYSVIHFSTLNYSLFILCPHKYGRGRWLAKNKFYEIPGTAAQTTNSSGIAVHANVLSHGG